LLKQRSRFSGNQVRTINAIGIAYQNPENAFRVISGDFVTTEDGTELSYSPTLVLMMLK
jgi:isoleucyl-tRNA synthetase